MRGWGERWTKNPTATSEQPGAEAGGRGPARAPCTHLRVGQPPKLPTPHIRSQLAPPPQPESKQGDLWVVLIPTAASGALVKPWLTFSSGLINLY